MLRAHPPSAYRAKPGVTEGGSSYKRHPQDVEDYRRVTDKVRRCHP